MNAHEDQVREAVRRFWATRGRQASTQGQRTNKDRGARSAVTGGRQMNGFVELVQHLLAEAGVPATAMYSTAKLELPGWFRAEKKWDLLVLHEDRLLASIEFKSQVGPSFGNNFNNRSEEAIGSATDIWAAYREGAFTPSSRPWLGYLMLLEDCPASRTPVKVQRPHFPVFREFEGASYVKRYELLIQKLLRDRLYDGACLLLSQSGGGRRGEYSEPHPELAFTRFVTPLVAHATALLRPQTGR